MFVSDKRMMDGAPLFTLTEISLLMSLVFCKEKEWWVPSFIYMRWNIAFSTGMYHFIDYEFCLMTDCKIGISGFCTSMIYGLVSEVLICSVCVDVSAVVTCYKKSQWSIALQCFSWQVCGRKVKGLCSGAAMTSRDFLVINLWFLIVTNVWSPLCFQKCQEQKD